MDTRTGTIYEYADNKAREQALQANPHLTPLTRAERRKLERIPAAERVCLLNELRAVAHNFHGDTAHSNAAKRARKARRK